jgi:hypothetical protein
MKPRSKELKKATGRQAHSVRGFLSGRLQDAQMDDTRTDAPWNFCRIVYLMSTLKSVESGWAWRHVKYCCC